MFHNFIHLTNLSYIILNFIQYTEELKAEKVSNAALDKAVDDVKNEASAMTETMPTERRAHRGSCSRHSSSSSSEGDDSMIIFSPAVAIHAVTKYFKHLKMN